jgi:acyl carrier protein
MRQLIAEKLRKTEDQVQLMLEKGDSLDRVELVMASEEIVAKVHR